MTEELTVHGMTCQGCEEVVETALEMADGVTAADADRYEDIAVVESAADAELDRDELAAKVELAGYEPAV